MTVRQRPGAARFAALLLLACASSARSAPGRNDIVYSSEVVTPHVAWAKQLAGGPLTGFFIPSVAEGRDMVELMQRLSLTATTVSIDRSWDLNCWGIGDYYGHEYRGDIDDFRTVYGYVEADLTSAARFEVMLIPGLNGWSRLTRASRDAILHRVQEGAGLVLLHPFVGDVEGHPFKGDEPRGDERLWELSPLIAVPNDFVSERGYPEPNEAAIARGRWELAAPHFITEGIPLDLLPGGHAGSRFYRYRAQGDVLIRAGEHPILATRSYGKGRVVAFGSIGEGFIPEAVDPVASRIYWNYWEYEYALLVKSLLWAARGDPPVRLEGLQVEGPSADPASLTARLSTTTPREVEIEVSGRSEFGDELGRLRERRSLAAGASLQHLSTRGLRPARGWSGGRSIVDAIVRDVATGANLAFGATSFVIPKLATLASVKPNASVYRRGETMSVVTRAAGTLEGVQVRLEVRDDLGRLLHAEAKPTSGEKYFFYALDDFLGKRASLRASLIDAGGRVVDELRGAPVLVVQEARRAKEYRGLLSFETPRHDLAELRLQRLHAQAIDAGFTWGGDVNDSLELPRGYFGTYWYDRGPTTPEALEKAIQGYEQTGDFASLQYLTKKELFRRTGDKKFLVRNPSLDDPAVRRRLADLGRTAARNKAVYNMDYYFVGDEGSLGSYGDPVDFDFGEHALASFRKWLAREYGSLEALNLAWQSHYRDWDAILPATTEEARKSGVFPPWADHRTYMEASFANAYQVVRDAVTEADPLGHIALSGTQATTPYDGCDWYRLDQVVDDFLSYDGGNQWDFHRAFAKPGAWVGFWTGYGRRGIGVQHEIWNAALSGVLHPNIFWSPSVLNPDLTFSQSGRDMGAALQALRFGGIGRLLMEADRLDDGIGVHYSMASVHAAGILGLHAQEPGKGVEATFPADRDGWVRSLGDLGFAYDFVSYAQLARGLDPGRMRVFVLPLSLAVSPAEASALEAFARAGGIVVADAAAGLLDEHCAWRSSGLLNDFFGIAAPPSSERLLTGTPRAGPVLATAAGAAWGLDGNALEGLASFETTIRPQGSVALLDVGGTSAAFTRRVGKGWAVYLNVLVDRYPALRKESYGGAAYRTLLAGILGHLGVRPAVELKGAKGQVVGPARIARFLFGDAELVAILPEPVTLDTAYGRDGVSVYDDAQLGKLVRQELELRLGRAGDVTNLRTGESLGHGDHLKVSAVAGDALLLAVGPPRGTLAVLGPSSARLGEHPHLALRASARGKRVVRASAFGPDGGFLPDYSRTLFLDGSAAEFVLPSALSDPPGRYLLRFVDVVSGAAAEAQLELQ